jgi:integrase/recombinase XerD
VNTQDDLVSAYLARFSAGSQPAIRHALQVIAALVDAPARDPRRMDWTKLTPERCEEMRATLLRRFARATANRVLMALRGLTRLAVERGLVEAGLESCFRGESGSRAPRPGVAPEELARLFESCHADGAPGGCRDAAALALLYAVGLKRAEAVALDRADYLASGELVVKRAPRRRAVTTPLAHCVREALDAWIELRGDGPGPLLCPVNKSGKIDVRRMTAQALYLIVKRRAQSAGVRISPDNLSKTYVRRSRAAARRIARKPSGAERAMEHVVMLHVPFRGCGPKGGDVARGEICSRVL